MAEPDKQYTGDGNDNYTNSARNMAQAARQFGQSGANGAAAAGGHAAVNSTAAAGEAAANAAGMASGAAVQAAAEGGGAVAEIATGTAVGGPWGAAIAAAWSLRHTLFKVLITICLVIVFIVVTVVSLPSIVYNYTFNRDTVNAADITGTSNIAANFNAMSSVVSECSAAGYEAAKAQVDGIITSGGYDRDLSMAALIDNSRVSPDYDVCYILAAYSASMGQKNASEQDLKNKLNAVASQMFSVTYEAKEKTVTKPPASPGGQPKSETVKYIVCTIGSFDISVISTAFGLNMDAPYGDFNVRTGDAIEDMANALRSALYGASAGSRVPPLTDAELTDFLNNLTCSPARKALMNAALSLVGKVPYFWGGKSGPGWNNDWNTPKLVTASGDSTTGTIIPYGLDCSGFTDWVYKTALGVSIGDGSGSQWSNSTAITASELLPGDLGFLDQPGSVSVNHVLIYAGKDSSGNKLWVHCSGSYNGVALNSPGYVKYYRRVNGVNL